MRVEQLIQDNFRDEQFVAAINKQRDELIKEIRYVEAYNFRALIDLYMNQSEVLSDAELFPKF